MRNAWCLAVLIAMTFPGGSLLRGEDGSPRAELPFEIPGDAPLDLAFAPQTGRLATCGKDGVVQFWNLQTQTATPLVGHTHDGDVWSVAFSPDGKLLASGGGNPGYTGEVFLWNVERGERLALAGHRDTVTCVTFSPDGKLLASSSDDGTVRLWNLATLQHVQLADLPSKAHRVAFAPGGELLATASADGTIGFHDVPANRRVATLRGHRAAVSDVAFSADGRRLVSASHDGTLRLWDVAGRRAITTVNDAEPARQAFHSLLRVAFTADGRSLTYLCADGSLRFRSATDLSSQGTLRLRREPNRLGGYRAFSQSPDGLHLAAAGGGVAARFWNLGDLLPTADDANSRVSRFDAGLQR